MKTVSTRPAKYNINDIFQKRYSPRAMSGELISRRMEDLLSYLQERKKLSSRGKLEGIFLEGKTGTSQL